MICPRCASEQSDEVEVLQSVRARTSRLSATFSTTARYQQASTGARHGSPTCSSRQAEQKRRGSGKSELQSGITPEEKRRTEIKAGVIYSCRRLRAWQSLLYFLMQGNHFERQGPPALKKYSAAFGLPE